MFKLSSHAQTQFSCSTLEFDTKISLSFELSFCKIIMDYGIWMYQKLSVTDAHLSHDNSSVLRWMRDVLCSSRPPCAE